MWIPSLKTRQRSNEWMDDPSADPELLRLSLRYLRRMNFLLGYSRASIAYLDRFSRRWKRGGTIRILDLATGSADMPRSILRWADRRGWDVRVTGIDLIEKTARTAAIESDDPRISIICADGLNLPFEAGSFDYAHTALFLHHLDTPDAVRVLAGMARVARRGIIAADLLRNRRAYAWIKLMSLRANPMVKNDGPASVAQAYTKAEVLEMREQAGVQFAQFHIHFGHRFVLAGEK